MSTFGVTIIGHFGYGPHRTVQRPKVFSPHRMTIINAAPLGDSWYGEPDLMQDLNKEFYHFLDSTTNVRQDWKEEKQNFQHETRKAYQKMLDEDSTTLLRGIRQGARMTQKEREQRARAIETTANIERCISHMNRAFNISDLGADGAVQFQLPDTELNKLSSVYFLPISGCESGICHKLAGLPQTEFGIDLFGDQCIDLIFEYIDGIVEGDQSALSPLDYDNLIKLGSFLEEIRLYRNNSKWTNQYELDLSLLWSLFLSLANSVTVLMYGCQGFRDFEYEPGVDTPETVKRSISRLTVEDEELNSMQTNIWGLEKSPKHNEKAKGTKKNRKKRNKLKQSHKKTKQKISIKRKY